MALATRSPRLGGTLTRRAAVWLVVAGCSALGVQQALEHRAAPAPPNPAVADESVLTESHLQSAVVLARARAGSYLCSHCGAPLYRGTQLIGTTLGWYTFGHSQGGGAVRVQAVDWQGETRIQLSCTRCGAHLGWAHFVPREGLHQDVRHSALRHLSTN